MTQARDSLGREWAVGVVNGLPVLSPIGHDTDPDGPGLSVEDELALMRLIPESPVEAEEDGFGPLYDRLRDQWKDLQIGAM